MITVALAFVATSGAGAQKTAAPDWAAFDRYVAQAARDWHVPALAIAVVKDDSLVFAKGYGVLEAGKSQPANEHTRFAIGSTTKAMTSASLAMLVDEGKIHWDDHVSDYIPELQLYDSYASHELTIRDLLTHRTGLPGTDLFWARWHYTLPEVIRGLRYIKPESSFRSNWSYQNVMYALSGTIVERVSGMSWEAFVRSRIFAPLGMNESETLVSEIAGKPNVSVPHYLVGDSVRVVPMRSTDLIAPAGSVWSSVSDMSKWMRFILDSGRVGDKRLIKASTFRELITPQIQAPMDEYPALQLSRPDYFSYGLGWFIQDYAGQHVWMHTGSIDGQCAIIGLMPNEHLGVYVLENLDHAELRHALMYRAFDLYNGGPSRDWSAEVAALFARARQGAGAVAQTSQRVERPASVAIERYAGTYVDSAYGTVTVTNANGKLRARVVSDPEADLDHLDVDSFRTHPANPRDQIALTFTPDGAGGVSAVRISGVSFVRVRSTNR
jgi:CubicO group peptidase (beta-lactamase class C family)